MTWDQCNRNVRSTKKACRSVMIPYKSPFMICQWVHYNIFSISRFFHIFMPIAVFFVVARILVFFVNTDKKNYQSYRNFCHWEIYFLRGKTLALGRKMSFMGQCKTFLIIWNDKKTVFALARLVLAFGLFLGFVWPSEGHRPSSGQNNPKNGPQAKTTWLQQKKYSNNFTFRFGIWKVIGII